MTYATTARLRAALLCFIAVAACDEGDSLITRPDTGAPADSARPPVANDAGARDVVSAEVAVPDVAAAEAGAPDAGAPDAPVAVDAPTPTKVFALMTQVYRNDDRDVYISLSNTLDVKSADLAAAREFNGVANFAAIGGRLLVSSGQQPIITSYDIGDDLKWTMRGTVSFANYPLSDNANWYYQFILDDHTVYLPFDGTKRLVWDPSSLEIRGVMDDTTLALEREGLLLEAGGNRNSVRYKGPVLQAFFYHDKDWVNHGTLSHAVSYDPITHKQRSVIDIPCPGLSIATQDEGGNTYLSTWGYSGAQALFKKGAAPCVARIKPDYRLDAGFTTDLTDRTGGRYVNNFRYVGHGKAIGNVLHHELLGVADWTVYDPAIVDKIWETGPHWRLWIFDMNAGTAKPVEGVGVPIGSGAQFAVMEGRTFVFLPYMDWGRSKVYELDTAGVATERMDVTGDVFKWIQVR